MLRRCVARTMRGRSVMDVLSAKNIPPFASSSSSSSTQHGGEQQDSSSDFLERNKAAMRSIPEDTHWAPELTPARERELRPLRKANPRNRPVTLQDGEGPMGEEMRPPSEAFDQRERDQVDDDIASVTGGMVFNPSGMAELDNPLGALPSDKANPMMGSFAGKQQYLDEKAKPEALSRNEYKPLSMRVRQQIQKTSEHKTYHEVTSEDGFGDRVDEYMQRNYPQWDRLTVRRLVENGHIYRYRRNGRQRFTRMTDRLEHGEFLVVPKEGYWEKGLQPPEGLRHPKPFSPTDDAENPFSEGKASNERPAPKVYISAKMKEKALEWVLFKNEHVVVVNKPAGLPMEPEILSKAQKRHNRNEATNVPSTQLTLSALLDVYKFTYVNKPLICNRLDRDASGIVVLARTPNTHRMLARMFMRRVIPNNVYWCFLSGTPVANTGRVKVHLEKDTENPSLIVARPTASPNSRVAVAEYVVNASAGEYGSWVSFYPLTSQTYQQRIMAAHALRCPILGDGRFGGQAAYPTALAEFFDAKVDDAPFGEGSITSMPLYMHHRKIQLPYKSEKGEYMCITAPLPEHMEAVFRRLGWSPNAEDPMLPG